MKRLRVKDMFLLNRKQQLAFLLLAVIIIIETGFIIRDQFFIKPAATEIVLQKASDKNAPLDVTNNQSEIKKNIEVYIIGRVQKPGVVAVPKESRLKDAIIAAGGLMADADSLIINLARKINDGERIYIPAVGENKNASIVTTEDTGDGVENTKVNINTADADTMDKKLLGIGPSRAVKIIEYREKNGPFKTIEDLKNISGIGDKIFDGFKDDITVE